MSLYFNNAGFITSDATFLDSAIRGLLTQTSQTVDNLVSRELWNSLFRWARYKNWISGLFCITLEPRLKGAHHLCCIETQRTNSPLTLLHWIFSGDAITVSLVTTLTVNSADSVNSQVSQAWLAMAPVNQHFPEAYDLTKKNNLNTKQLRPIRLVCNRSLLSLRQFTRQWTTLTSTSLESRRIPCQGDF